MRPPPRVPSTPPSLHPPPAKTLLQPTPLRAIAPSSPQRLQREAPPGWALPLQPPPQPKGCSSTTLLGGGGCPGQPLPPVSWYLLGQDASSFTAAVRFPDCSERRRGRTPFLSRVSCQLPCSLWPSGTARRPMRWRGLASALCSADLGRGCCGAEARTLRVAWETAEPLAHEDHATSLLPRPWATWGLR